MSEFKSGDKVVVYGAAMRNGSADGNAASRRIGIVRQEPDTDDDSAPGEVEFMTVIFSEGTSVSVSPKQCRRLRNK